MTGRPPHCRRPGGDALVRVPSLIEDSGGAHLHITIADATGAVLGGHLVGCSLVRTTAELVIRHGHPA
ncbi:PPC domain-containing DNA-binding protein [Synechococcus sp. CBW1004]|uniref:PPC domain-containing DNA-binding protein n=1 Tax=Synechococcus sp. CBW1004 TaxID=1353136 RepID=UPI001E5562F8|nr:PPC domain-containing DNA-binding protein [Synechococcus sp. CBW1004]